MNSNEKSQKAELRMKRIQKVSRLVWVFFRIALIVEGIGMAAGAIALPLILIHWPAVKSQAAFKNCCALLTLPFVFMVTLSFCHVFSRLKDGQLFEGQTIKYLENAGKWWIVLAVIQALFQFLHGYLYSPANIIVNGNGIFGGLVIFFIAWVLREGQELKEEQELTV